MSSTPQNRAPRLKLTITATAETIVRGGHPWIYSDSIRTQSRDAQAGELAVIYDRKDKFLAVGLFDPDSPLRVEDMNPRRGRIFDVHRHAVTISRAPFRRDTPCWHTT